MLALKLAVSIALCVMLVLVGVCGNDGAALGATDDTMDGAADGSTALTEGMTVSGIEGDSVGASDTEEKEDGGKEGEAADDSDDKCSSTSIHFSSLSSPKSNPLKLHAFTVTSTVDIRQIRKERIKTDFCRPIPFALCCR